jgi:glycosyltransferase involved in cell wall biosynthesis
LSEKKIRVCLWAPIPPPTGGISLWAQKYMEVAERYGLCVTIVNIAPPVGEFSEQSAFRFNRLGVAFGAFLDLWRQLRHQRPDICHVTSSLAWATPRDAIAVLICRLHGVPTVLNIRVSTQVLELRESLSGFWRALFDRFMRWPNVVLVLSRELEDYLLRVLPGLRVERLGNMVRPHAEAVQTEPVLPARSDRGRVLFVGSLTPLKGIIELARAIVAIPDCELVTIGELGAAADEQTGRQQTQALAALRDTGRLIEMGQLSPREVAKAYEEADIFVLPSHREGMPNVLLEAQAAGVPIVGTPVGAIPDILEGGCGELVPLKDEAALRQVLNELLQHPERRQELVRQGKERVAERYLIDVVMRGYVEIYRSILVRDSGQNIP